MAAIRNSDDGAGNGVEMVSVWHLPTNTKLSLAGCPPAGTWALGEPSPLASDGVQVTNSRAIVIGSYDGDPTAAGQETTHVNILNIDTDADPPTTVSCLWNHVFDQTYVATVGLDWNATTYFGDAHDVALLLDESKAVVHQRNWVQFFHLRTGTMAIAFNLPLFTDTGNKPTTPNGITNPTSGVFNGARDSIAVSSNRVVVIANTYVPKPFPLTGFYARPWIFIFETNSGPHPYLAFAQAMVLNFPNFDMPVHDLVISEDESKVIVTMSDAVEIYSLNSPYGPPLYSNQFDGGRSYKLIADSVESRGSRAVVISNQAAGFQNQLQWKIDVIDLNSNPIAPVAQLVSSQSGLDRAYDIDISPLGQWAVVATDVGPQVIGNLQGTPTITGFSTFASPLAAGAHVSDAVIAHDGWAAVIGTIPAFGSFFHSRGSVAFLDLSGSTPAMPFLWTFGDGNNGSRWTQDLAMTRDAQKAIVRMSSTASDDILVFSTVPPNLGVLLAIYGAQGTLGLFGGLDSVEVGSVQAISASAFTMNPFTSGSGYVQVFQP
jgi:hypothetical protein